MRLLEFIAITWFTFIPIHIHTHTHSAYAIRMYFVFVYTHTLWQCICSDSLFSSSLPVLLCYVAVTSVAQCKWHHMNKWFSETVCLSPAQQNRVTDERKQNKTRINDETKKRIALNCVMPVASRICNIHSNKMKFSRIMSNDHFI